MIRQSTISRRRISIDLRAVLSVVLHEIMKRGRIRPRNDLGPNSLARTLLHADNRRLADWTSALMAPLLGMLVLLFAAEVGFIHFYGILEIG